MVPAHGGERGFGYWTRKMGAVPAAPLRYIGFRPPIQAPTVDCAPGSAPDRVDVSNRYLGNKVCKYDTSWVPPPEGEGGTIDAAQRGDPAAQLSVSV